MIFKIFWQIFQNYFKNTEYQDNWQGRSPSQYSNGGEAASGEALAKPLVLYKKASLHSLFRACREREKSTQQFESILLKTNYRQTGAVSLETLAKNTKYHYYRFQRKGQGRILKIYIMQLNISQHVIAIAEITPRKRHEFLC